MDMLNHDLSVFIRVADYGSVSQAAASLYVSQPAISKSIIQLEQQLGVRLFRRKKGKGLLLTDVGKKILLYAHQMQELENNIIQTAYLEKNYLSGILRIASFPIVTSTILSKAIYQYRTEFPKVDLELIDRDPNTVQRLAEEYAVDFGISASPFPRLDHETLFMDRMVGIGRTAEELPEKINLFKDSEYLIFCDAGKETTIDTLKNARSINFKNCLIVQNHETIINMVEEGNGIGVISEYTLNAIPNNLVRCPVEPLVEIEVALVAPSLSQLSPAAVEFVRILRAVSWQQINGNSHL